MTVGYSGSRNGPSACVAWRRLRVVAVAIVTPALLTCGGETADTGSGSADEATATPLVIPDVDERRAVLLAPDHPAWSEPAVIRRSARLIIW